MREEQITREWVVDRFDDIYPTYRTAFARLLVSLRDDLDGDLDSLLVLLTLSHGTALQNWRNTLMGRTEQAGVVRMTNTLSISQATGIPRESVRRKLATMEAKGWILRDADGNWVPTRRSVEDLRKGSLETIGFIRTLVASARAARPRTPEDAPDK
jgi:hypothetical protein